MSLAIALLCSAGYAHSAAPVDNKPPKPSPKQGGKNAETPNATPPNSGEQGGEGGGDADAAASAQTPAVKYAARADAAQQHIDALPNEIADAALRERLAELWQKALANWQAAEQSVTQLARRRQTVEGAAARLQAIKDESEVLRNNTSIPLGDAGAESVGDLEVELHELDRNLPEWSKELSQRESRIESQARRLADSRKAAEEAKARLAEKAAPIPDDSPPALKAALRQANWSRRVADQEIVAGNDYYASVQETLNQLNSAEHELLSRRMEFGRIRREGIAQRIAAKRRDEAEKLRLESEAAAEGALHVLPPILQEVAEDNRKLASALELMQKREQEQAARLQYLDDYIQALQGDYDRIREQLESGGGGAALGPYLWSKRRSLQREAYQTRQRGDAFADPNLSGFSPASLEAMRRRAPRLERELVSFASRPDMAGLPEVERAALQERGRKMLEYHAKLISDLTDVISHQATISADIETHNKKLRRLSGQYTALVERYILQLPGSPPIWRVSFGKTVQAVAGDLFSARLWHETAKALTLGFARSPWLVFFLVLALFPSLITHLMSGWLKSLNLKARTPLAGQPRGLLWRVGLAFLCSYHAPLLLLAIGGAIWRDASPGSGAAAIGEALLSAIMPAFLLNFWRHLCDAGGILQEYVKTPDILRERLRRRLSSVMCIGLPLWVFTWFSLCRADPEEYQEFSGVVSIVLATLGLAFWLSRMRPAVFLRDSAPRWPGFWYCMYIVVIALGLAWLGLSIYGYNYGALLLIRKSTISALLVTALALTAGYWLLRLERSRERQRARAIIFSRFGDTMERRRRKEKQQGEVPAPSGLTGERKDAAKGGQATNAGISDVVEQELNDSFAGARRLVLWLFAVALVATMVMQWADLFPVLEWLGKLPLWSRDNAPGLTLLAIISAFIGGGLCYAISNPLGSWINLSFFGWNPSERGTRVATAALIRYAMVGAGVIWAAQELGISWSDAQWLVAALSVGLGFGLQEIILNFVSGIILLFERPVRVGDMVTIGTAEGTISRINIRTTTLLDADRRELIIPNKELVTGRVTNWTLSDTITRVVIQVGVAYGSDLELVQRILLEAADEVDAILVRPEPSVFFLNMAENGLNFELRVYTGRLDDRVPVQHQLRLGINRLFQKNNIEIPFPQLDVHMRS